MEKQSALVRTFYDDGFRKIPSFFSAAELAEIEKNLGRFVRELIPSLAPVEVFYEDKNLSGSLKQIQRMHEYDSFFFNLFHEKPKPKAKKRRTMAPFEISLSANLSLGGFVVC